MNIPLFILQAFTVLYARFHAEHWSHESAIGPDTGEDHVIIILNPYDGSCWDNGKYGDCESSEEGPQAHLRMGDLGKDEEVGKNGKARQRANIGKDKDKKHPGLWKDLCTVPLLRAGSDGQVAGAGSRGPGRTAQSWDPAPD